MPERGRTWAVIAGGGTAGHAVPAVAVGQALVRRGHAPGTIHFLGSTRGPEGAMARDAGFSATLLPGRGLNERRMTAANLRAAGGLSTAMAMAVTILARRRPRVVLSVGGFAALPGAMAAGTLRLPLVLAESNIVPGDANRLAARFASASAVQFEGTPLPHAVVTGNPVRDAILAVDRTPEGREQARRSLGLPADATVVAAFGGSLGSRRINHAVYGLVEQWAGRAGVAVRHAVGHRDWAADEPARPAPAPGGVVYQAVEYEHRMPELLAAADVMVCRAGGSTLAELGIAGLPAILVPLPIATADHQMANARAVERLAAAAVVPDAELDADRLARELEPLVADAARRGAMGTAMAGFGHPDAADRVAELMELHARP
ncbi:MAG TPA: UDP-N-acetylglucosamine--N-acetylmuramyl-(pentapeptide) pyrophosphoryl-undecaprenol N-acetylglucosamine transferase [Acidimicrobiales bacterium]|nr:UDP-N-acetylglucosamine--N-acetylmuramyl-(pentapeptide) pyrophosphoryl-undecaprenol N-acetylglucosamine transferase [Acidimicrobiales bacterium]